MFNSRRQFCLERVQRESQKVIIWNSFDLQMVLFCDGVLLPNGASLINMLLLFFFYPGHHDTTFTGGIAKYAVFTCWQRGASCGYKLTRETKFKILLREDEASREPIIDDWRLRHIWGKRIWLRDNAGIRDTVIKLRNVTTLGPERRKVNKSRK